MKQAAEKEDIRMQTQTEKTKPFCAILIVAGVKWEEERGIVEGLQKNQKKKRKALKGEGRTQRWEWARGKKTWPLSKVASLCKGG